MDMNNDIDSFYNLLLNLLLNTNTNIIFYILFFLIFYSNLNMILIIFIFHLLCFSLDIDIQYIDINILEKFEFKININLFNGLFLIHPLFIYMFLITFFKICKDYINYIFIYYTFKLNIKNYTFFFKIKIISTQFLSNLILLAIVLGSWWALQELNWGTWWNWDLVEIINLLYFIALLKIIHNNILIFFKQYFKLLNLIGVFMLCVLAVRLNLIQSIHNFINANDFNQFLKYLMVFLYFYIIYPIKNYFLKFSYNKSNIKIYNFLSYFYKSVIIFLVVLIFYSYIKLKNNQIINVFIFIWFLYFILIINLININKLIRNKATSYILILFNETLILINFFKILYNLYKFKFLHFTIIIFIFICLIKIININQILLYYTKIYSLVTDEYNQIADFNLFNNSFNIKFNANDFDIDLKKYNQIFYDFFIFSDELFFQKLNIDSSILEWLETDNLLIQSHGIYKINSLLLLLISNAFNIFFLKKIRKII